MRNNNITNFSYGESKRKQILASFGIADEFQKSITSNDMLEKGGKHGQIGEIRNGYKKIAEGKWQKVSNEGLTTYDKKYKSDGVDSRVIGKTKSGKDVYNHFDHESHENFTKQDHLDASDLHQARYDKYMERSHDNPHSGIVDKMDNNMDAHEKASREIKEERVKIPNSLHETFDFAIEELIEDEILPKDFDFKNLKVSRENLNKFKLKIKKIKLELPMSERSYWEETDEGFDLIHDFIEKNFKNGNNGEDKLEKGLDTSHLTLKQVTDKNGKQTKRWVDANGKEHAEHGSHADFEHGGEKKSGKVGRVSSSGKYVIHGDDGTIYKKHHHEIKPRANGNQVTGQPTAKVKQDGKKLNTPHHKLARTKSSDVLKRYISGKDTTHEYHTSAEDVLKERGELPADHKSTFKGKVPDAKADASANKIQAKLDDDNKHPLTDDDNESDADIVKRITLKFKDFAGAVNAVCDGMKKSAIMYGSGGVGKTFTVKKTLKRKFGKDRMFDPKIHTPGSDDYDYVFIDGGKVTATSFYQLMWEHNDKVMVFDDCDSALEDPDIKGYMKGALGSSQSQVSNMSQREVKASDGSKIPKQFDFGGKMIFITNIPKDTITKSKEMQPIMSRSFAQDLSMDRKDTMTYIKHIAKKDNGELTNMEFDGIKNYSHDEMDHVIKMLDKHKDKAFDINARSVETLLAFSKMSTAEVESQELDREEAGKPPLTKKEKEEIFNEEFNRKSIDYLYQHKTVNGKLDKNYIAKGFVEMFGCSPDEACAYIRMGLKMF
jgi:hypothetical protein